MRALSGRRHRKRRRYCASAGFHSNGSETPRNTVIDFASTAVLVRVKMQIPGVGIRRSTLRLFALFTFYIVFLVVGAAVFSAIQDPEETRIVNDLRRAREKFLQFHHCVEGK
ncbi:UNVERIFIED_CONTAM: hypothetical protein PYX00_003293 [Menopon gallinae]|uniref:Uncharacterized protein n=1 Tax=Menopon gallinae TaxID=328185 RepID=A0AAW2I1U7_9NEOP